MSVELNNIDEKTACACLFLSEDLTAIAASQVEQINRLNAIIVRQAELILKKDDQLQEKDDLIERLNIDLAAQRGRLHGL